MMGRFLTRDPNRNDIKRIADIFIDNGNGIRGDLEAIIKAALTDPDVFSGLARAAGQGTQDEHQHFR